MNLDQRKLRLIQFISELEDETFFDYIESVIESSGERFGVQLPEIQDKKVEEPQNDGDDLLTRFYAVTSDFDDEETIEKILETEFTEDEQFRILLLLRSEDIKKYPEQMLDAEKVFEKWNKIDNDHELV